MSINLLKGFILLFTLMFFGAFINLTRNGVPITITFPILIAISLLALALFCVFKGKYLYSQLIVSIVPVYLMVYVSVAVKTFGVLDNLMMYLIPRTFTFAFLIAPIILFGIRKIKQMIVVVLIDLIPITLFDFLHRANGIWFDRLEFEPGFYHLFLLLLIIFFTIIFSSILMLQWINKIFVKELKGKNLELDQEKKIIKRQNNSLKNQAYLYRILDITSGKFSFSDTLAKVLDEIFLIEGLETEKKGGIFLVNTRGYFEIAVQKNLDNLLDNYNSVESENCICEKISEKENLFFCREATHLYRLSKQELTRHKHYIIPLKNEGKTVGVLLLYKKNKIVKEQNNVSLLKAIAEILSNKLRLEEYHEQLLSSQREISEKNEILNHTLEELNGSLSYATSLQNSMLPSAEELNNILGPSFCIFHPRDKVSGDFYFSRSFGNDSIFGVGDCTGHGIPGAILASMSLDSLHQILRDFPNLEVNKILDKLREMSKSRFYPNLGGGIRHDSMDAAICKFSKKTNILSFAGGNMGAVIIRSGEIIELKPTKNPIGHFLKQVPFEKVEIKILKEDVLYIFSDGITDQFGHLNTKDRIKKLRRKNLYEWLLEMQSADFSQHYEILNNKLVEWQNGVEQTDDITLLSVQF